MPDTERVMVIRCPKCRKKAFKYLKVGQGKVIRCFKDRMRNDKTHRQGKDVTCPCGNLLARDQGDHLKMLVPLRLD